MLNFKNDRCVRCNDTLLYSNLGTINPIGKKLPLFGRSIDGTIGSIFVGRIYSAQITDNTILARDLIPVRVGQVGYMYDRVSKKLFGNAGTGAFVLGPDVATPVIGLRRYP